MSFPKECCGSEIFGVLAILKKNAKPCGGVAVFSEKGGCGGCRLMSILENHGGGVCGDAFPAPGEAESFGRCGFYRHVFLRDFQTRGYALLHLRDEVFQFGLLKAYRDVNVPYC